MRIGGKCPLNLVEDQETYIRTELEKFNKEKIIDSDVDSMRKEFCRNICKNITC